MRPRVACTHKRCARAQRTLRRQVRGGRSAGGRAGLDDRRGVHDQGLEGKVDKDLLAYLQDVERLAQELKHCKIKEKQREILEELAEVAQQLVRAHWTRSPFGAAWVTPRVTGGYVSGLQLT